MVRLIDSAPMFELLSKSFDLPSDELASSLTSGEYTGMFQEICGQLHLDSPIMSAAEKTFQDYEGRQLADVKSALRREHSRLFLAQPDVLVHSEEGVWREAKRGNEVLSIINPIAIEVLDYYKTCGVFPADNYRDAIDLVCTECQFMQLLSMLDSLPESSGMTPSEAQERFIEEHMGLWIPGFCAEVREQTIESFYNSVAAVLSELISLVASDAH